MKKVIIIGSGIAGLSAGCFLQMNGYDTEIFESHARAGGMCAAWERKGYLIDSCIHWFVGGDSASVFYKIWDSLVGMKNLPVVVYDEYCSVEHEGRVVRFYSDIEKLAKELKDISPEDTKAIDEFAEAVQKLAAFDRGNDNDNKSITLAKKISMIFSFEKWRIPVAEYAGKFKSGLIRHFLITSMGENAPMLFLLMNAAWFHNRNAGYPSGGAQGLVRLMVKRYASLGGRTRYLAKVSRLIVENGSVKGVALENGENHSADIVVSAAHGRSTVQDMLENKYNDKNIGLLNDREAAVPRAAVFHVSLGVARKFDESFKPYVFFDLKNPIRLEGREHKTLGVTIYNFCLRAASEGKTVLTVSIGSCDPGYWIILRHTNRDEYDNQKNALAQHVIDELEGHFGNIKNNLEMIDVATPATYLRYTNSRKGTFVGWTDYRLLVLKSKKGMKGLKNFYMCGQWVGDSGLPGAAASGMDAAEMICERDGREFKILRCP